jgi:hypothetical protein
VSGLSLPEQFTLVNAPINLFDLPKMLLLLLSPTGIRPLPAEAFHAGQRPNQPL